MKLVMCGFEIEVDNLAGDPHLPMPMDLDLFRLAPGQGANFAASGTIKSISNLSAAVETVTTSTKESEWAQYQFEKPRSISGVEVYWFDNGSDRKVPESWRILYMENGEWKPVEALDDYALKRDTFNEVKFKPVVTDGLKLEVRLQAGVAAGIQEWRVIP